MKNYFKKYFAIRGKREEGFTLLEYCAGAAVIMGIVLAGMTALEGGITGYFTNLSTYLKSVTIKGPTTNTP